MKPEPDNKVQVQIGGLNLSIDPDQDWEEFKSKTFQEQLEKLGYGRGWHWVVQLHEIGLSEKIKRKFLECYDTEDAVTARKVAVHGLCWLRYTAERDVLNDLMEITEKKAATFAVAGKALDEGGADQLSICSELISWHLLGEKFRERILAKDHMFFERMAAIVKEGRTPPPESKEKQRGGEDSLDGRLFREFCQRHVRTRSLPTKKELREACGKAGSNEDYQAIGAALKRLGLNGLPSARDLLSKR